MIVRSCPAAAISGSGSSVIATSSDTCELLAVAQALTHAVYRKGYRYKKAGVGLLNLTRGDTHQGDLFAQIAPRSSKLMAVVDAANRKFGRGTIGTASTAWGPKGKPQWSMRQENLSPAYTRRWDQLLRVR
ncbi:DUF4113 domain-containing protein [Xanthomonas campestris pv. raphani]|nr:DUF4113 domain-containing protein [Xanthomonas campestris pv. raphani]